MDKHQIELAKSILESRGYTVERKLQESQEQVINSGCTVYPSDHEGDDIVLKLGDDYPIILSFRVNDQARGDQIYEGLVSNLHSSVAEAVDYCMKNGFSISYQSTHLYK